MISNLHPLRILREQKGISTAAFCKIVFDDLGEACAKSVLSMIENFNIKFPKRRLAKLSDLNFSQEEIEIIQKEKVTETEGLRSVTTEHIRLLMNQIEKYGGRVSAKRAINLLKTIRQKTVT